MKVTQINRVGEYGHDDLLTVEMVTDTHHESISFGEGEPEDMSLTRDLSDAYNISDLLREAWEAGKRGEEFEFEAIEQEED